MMVSVQRLKYGLMALFTSAVFIVLGLLCYIEGRDFESRLSLMLSGAALSTGVTLIIVEWITEVIKKDQEQTRQRKAKEADIELHYYIESERLNFIKLGSELGELELWTTKWDGNKMGLSCFNFINAIEQQENSLYIHTKRSVGYENPLVEAKKEAYLYGLRQLRTIFHSLALSQNKGEKISQFNAAKTEFNIIASSLLKRLEESIGQDASNSIGIK